MGAKAVIIDHEPLMAAQLKKLLQRGDPSIEVKSICYEGEQAMACLAAHQPDIVFLTLEMPRVSGMTIARQIEAAKGPHPAVVFVTGKRDFISQALRLNVLDYLVKPVTEEEVRRVVEKFRAVYIKKKLLCRKELPKQLLTAADPVMPGVFPSMKATRSNSFRRKISAWSMQRNEKFFSLPCRARRIPAISVWSSLKSVCLKRCSFAVTAIISSTSMRFSKSNRGSIINTSSSSKGWKTSPCPSAGRMSRNSGSTSTYRLRADSK